MPLYGPRYIFPPCSAVIFVMYTETILFDCGDFMEEDAAGNEIRPRELSKTCFTRPVLVHFSLSLSFDLFFPSFAFFLPPLHGSNERMRFMHILENNLNYSWNRFFYGGRVSMYKLWNFRIVIIVILFLRWTDTLSSSESIYVKSEIRSLDDLVKC